MQWAAAASLPAPPEGEVVGEIDYSGRDGQMDEWRDDRACCVSAEWSQAQLEGRPG